MKIALTRENTKLLPSFKKDFNSLDPKDSVMLKQSFFELLDKPDLQNIKHLRDYPLGRYRLRVGNFRAFFNYEKNIKKYVFTAMLPRKVLY